ncbi:MAG: hypothetical protein ACRECQ_01990 [Burkholderiaceae bacterium]
MKRRHQLTLALLAASIAVAAAAQTSTTPLPGSAQKAADASIAAPALRYRSAFDGYVSANGDKAISWRDANALVGSIGGWRAYAREAQQAAPTNEAPAAAGDKPPPHKAH